MSDDELEGGLSSFWALEVQPGKTYSQTLPLSLVITQVTLPASAKNNERVSISVIVDDKEFTLGSLKLGHCEQFPLDLHFDEGQEVTFKVTGKNNVHLLGYYIEEEPEEFDSYDDMIEDEEDFNEVSFDEEEGEDIQDFIARLKNNDRVEVLEEKQHGEENKGSGATVANPTSEKKKKKNKKRKESAEQPENAKKLKQDLTSEPAQTPSKEKAQTPSKEKAQTPSKEKAQTPSKEKAQTPAAKEKSAQTPGKESAKKESQTPKKVDLVEPQTRKLPNGLIIDELSIGTGSEVSVGKKVSVKYVGKFSDGRVFDSAQSKPFIFRLGTSQVIKGWDIGIKGMRKGGVRKLTIPPSLGYGAKGAPPAIPANSTLIFEVELVDFK